MRRFVFRDAGTPREVFGRQKFREQIRIWLKILSQMGQLLSIMLASLIIGSKDHPKPPTTFVFHVVFNLLRKAEEWQQTSKY